ncbi:MAG: carboxypeptidase regulatory-like domain-containing protein [bacterium]|nr:carboxypeptidase regulatory-like domain-containing protein [bacterium]
MFFPYPNPFNNAVYFAYILKESANIEIKVWRLPDGKKVLDTSFSQPPGYYTAPGKAYCWSYDSYAVYFVKFKINGQETEFKVGRSSSAPIVNILSPASKETVSGIKEIKWGASNVSGNVLLEYSSNEGAKSWNTIAQVPASSGSYNWNTNDLPNGDRYAIKVSNAGNTLVYSGVFAVNNKPSSPPEVEVLSPEGGVIYKDFQDIQWKATSSSGLPLLINLYLSLDDGANWVPLALREENDGLYRWDTRRIEDGLNYRIKLKVTDGISMSEVHSGRFGVLNNLLPNWKKDVELAIAKGSHEFLNAAPSVGVNEENLYLVWNDARDWGYQDEMYNHELYLKKSNDFGETWGQDTRITSVQTKTQLIWPNIAVNGNIIHIVWEEREKKVFEESGVTYKIIVYRICYKRSEDGGETWSEDVVLKEANWRWKEYEKVHRPNIVIDGEKVFVLWEALRKGEGSQMEGFQIYLKRSVDGGESWEEEKKITNTPYPGAEAIYISTGINSAGLHIGWIEYAPNLGYCKLYYKRSPDFGISWEEQVKIGNLFYSGGRVETLSSGKAYIRYSMYVRKEGVVFVWSDEFEKAVYCRNSKDGAVWEEKIKLFDLSDHFWMVSPLIIEDRYGWLHLFWQEDYKKQFRKIRYGKSRDGINWEIEKEKIAICNYNYHTSLPSAATTIKDIHLFWIDYWTEYKNKSYSIYYKSGLLDPTPPKIPVVTDSGRYASSTTQLNIQYQASDLESGIAEYQYAIGTYPGERDIRDWTSVGTDTEATITGLSLTQGKTYYVAVKARNPGGLWGDAGYSDGIKVDITPPTQPKVTDRGTYTNLISQLSCDWSSSDPESGVEYFYCVGTTKGGTDIVEWREAGPSRGVNLVGISLNHGTTYYFSVKARNGAGLWSDTGYSDGITVSSKVSLFGKITDSIYNHPVSGATVEVIKDGSIIASCSSDSSGEYRIDDLISGTYQIRVKKERIYRWWWWTWRILEYIPHTRFSVSIEGKEPVDFYLSVASWVETVYICEGNVANTDEGKNMDVSIRVNYDPHYWFYLYPNDPNYEIKNFSRCSIGQNGCWAVRWWWWWPIYKWYNIDWDNGTYIDEANNRLHVKVWISGYWWRRAYFNSRYTIEAQERKGLSSTSLHPVLKFEEPKRSFSPGKVKLQVLSGEDRGKMGIAEADAEVVSIMIKDVKDSLTTAEIKLQYDPKVLQIEDVKAPVLPDPSLAVFCSKDTDGIRGLENNNSLTIRTLIVDKDMLIGTYTDTGSSSLSYGTETEQGTETTEEENIAPIAHLMVKPKKSGKTLSVNDIMSLISIQSCELKNAQGEEIKVDIEEDEASLPSPKENQLLQSFPNPAGDGCWIPFQLAFSIEHLSINIYNIVGQKVRTIDAGPRKAGFYTKQDRAIYWDRRNDSGQRVASGLYYINLKAGEFSATKAMVVK